MIFSMRKVKGLPRQPVARSIFNRKGVFKVTCTTIAEMEYRKCNVTKCDYVCNPKIVLLYKYLPYHFRYQGEAAFTVSHHYLKNRWWELRWRWGANPSIIAFGPGTPSLWRFTGCQLFRALEKA